MKRFLAFILFVCALGAAEPKRVVILGDSLTAGYGIDPDEAFPALVQKKVEAAGLPFTVVNAGLSGDTTAGGLRRIDWISRQPMDVLILELGGNDGLRGIAPEETRANLQQIIDRTRAKFPTVGLVIAGMKMPGNMGEKYTAEFEKIFSDLAKKNGATLIPFLLEGVGGDPALNLPDRIHPTAEGHKIVAETIWKTLEPVLRGRVSPNTTGKNGKKE